MKPLTLAFDAYCSKVDAAEGRLVVDWAVWEYAYAGKGGMERLELGVVAWLSRSSAGSIEREKGS